MKRTPVTAFILTAITALFGSMIPFRILSQPLEDDRPQDERSYFQRLVTGDADTRCALVNVSYKFLSTPSAEAFAAKGTHAGIGLNLARFFSDQFILGVCIDTKQLQGRSSQEFSNAFRDHFNENYISSYSSDELGHIAETLKEGINGKAGYSVRGNMFSNVGIQFAPFPDRYGAIMLTVMRGGSSFSFSGPYDSEIYLNDNGKYLDISLKRTVGLELSMQPFRFFYTGRTPLTNGDTWKTFYKFLTLSFYYEQLNFQRSRFYDQPLETFLKPEFFGSKSTLNNFGIKIGLAIY